MQKTSLCILTDMADPEGEEGAGGEPRRRSRCYSVMLFGVDLLLLCFLVPRGTPMSVRLVLLIATRGALTTVGGAASIGMYQALLHNNGGEEATTLATAVNTLFGLDPEGCANNRQRRDTWAEMLSKVDQKTVISSSSGEQLETVEEEEDKKEKKEDETISTFPMVKENVHREELSDNNLEMNMNNTVNTEQGEVFTNETEVDEKEVEDTEQELPYDFESDPTNESRIGTKADMTEVAEPGFLFTNYTGTCDTRPYKLTLELFAGIISVILTTLLSILAGANLALTYKLVSRQKAILRKEEQLRQGFAALEELYQGHGGVFEDVNLQ